ncbi:MAG: hypothetical protein GZ088_12400 [Acidipila sp.]|nr:hypothetical protein [Acidipila sp.]
MKGRQTSHLALVLLIAAAAGAQHVPKLSVQNYKSEVDKLMALSTESAKKQLSGDVDLKVIATKCADELEKARSYGSVAVILDRENKQLRSHNAVAGTMTFDYVAPDRYHVVQNAWGGGPGYDFDEWVTIGDSYYTFTSIWIEGIEKALVPAGYDPRHTNRAWGLPKYVDVLRGEQPISGDMYLYNGKPYYLLVYVFPPSRHPEFPEFVARGSANLRLWIDSNTGLLAEADFVPVPEKPGNAPHREFKQVLVAYSGDIRVDPPAEVCYEDRPGMCFAFIALPPTEKAASEIKRLSHSNPEYGWSVSYPSNWTIDSKDVSFVRISSPAADGLCGFHSFRTDRIKTADELADAREKQDEGDHFTTSHSPKQRISLPNEVTGWNVVSEIRGGGRSRRIYMLRDGVAYHIDCEAHVSIWAKVEPSFAQMISSFTLERKP